MGFYSDKIKKYSKLISVDETNFEYAKSKALSLKDAYIKELISEIKFLNKMRTTEEVSTDEAWEHLTNTKREVDFINSLKPVDYVQLMIYVENYGLKKAQEEVSNNINYFSETLSTYQNKKGFLGKTSALFGVNKKIVDKKSSLLENEKAKLDYFKNEDAEWNMMTPENQAVYIVGRTMLENLADFDKKGHENYIQAKLEMQAKAEVSENAQEIEK